MNAFVSKPAVAGLLLLFTLISGVMLSRSGKPLNIAIFTLHKLIALAAVVVISVNAYHLYQVVDPRTFVQLAAITVAGLLFLALIISGALLSRSLPLPEAVLRIHQVAPLLALVSAGLAIYLLISSKSL